MPDLWHPAVCVKPDKQGFEAPRKSFLNNFYLPVFIKIFNARRTNRLKYKHYKMWDFIKNFKHIDQLPLVINNHDFSRNLLLSAVIFNF